MTGKAFWGIAAVAASLATVGAAYAAPSAGPTEAAFVVLGDTGPVVRVVTTGPQCPSIAIDGGRLPMTVRAPAETLAQRPTLSTPDHSKPSVFAATTCEAVLPRSARRVTVAGVTLPRVRREIRRIVVIGDTGCRLKASDGAYQACNDPAAYPFARVAARAAAWKPDLVVHVGDYLYRENSCPVGVAACAGSPWGYGWDAWQADLFGPGAPLFAAAPWVVVRGNHENCARAGQGWWRLLDPRPLVAGRDCNDPRDDITGDASSAYAVALGGGARVIVADLAIAGDKPTPADDPRFAQFAQTARDIGALSDHATYAFVATHKPILGLAARQKDGVLTLNPVTIGIQSVFATVDRDILPVSIGAVLSGHIHLWQQVSFPARYPSQFIAGFSGTKEDVVPIPAQLPPGASPVAGTAPEAFSSWVDGFGYMTLERRGAVRWRATVWNLAGKVVNRCTIVGRHSRCARDHVTS